MNRFFLIISVTIAWALIACAGTPKISFDRTSFDFGPAEPDSDLVHVFTFSNTGDATLIIEKVKAG